MHSEVLSICIRSTTDRKQAKEVDEENPRASFNVKIVGGKFFERTKQVEVTEKKIRLLWSGMRIEEKNYVEIKQGDERVSSK